MKSTLLKERSLEADDMGVKAQRLAFLTRPELLGRRPH